MFLFKLTYYQLVLIADLYVLNRTDAELSKTIDISINKYGSLNVDNDSVKIICRFQSKNYSIFFIKKEPYGFKGKKRN